MSIDFKEIVEAHKGGGKQDTFEMFARAFIDKLGYIIVDEVARGADGGKDLIVLENTKAVDDSVISKRWLVSCKHYAYSGKSVGTNDEINIASRVRKNSCTCFMGFYSTLASSSIQDELKVYVQAGEIEDYKLFNYGNISDRIWGFNDMEEIMKNYFPESFKRMRDLNIYRQPIELFIFYVKNNFSHYEPFLKIIYGSLENALLNFQMSEDFLDSLNKADFKIIEFDYIQSVFDDKTINNLIKSQNLNLFESIYFIIENFIFPRLELENRDVLGNIVSISFGGFNELMVIQFNKHLVIHSEYKTKLENVYRKLKQLV